MFKVIKGKENIPAHCNKFSVLLKEATAEQLEHLYHLGHKFIEVAKGKKIANKHIDNAEETNGDK